MTHPGGVLAGDIPEADRAAAVEKGATSDGAAASSGHGPGQPPTLARSHGRQLGPVRGALPVTVGTAWFVHCKRHVRVKYTILERVPRTEQVFGK